MSNSGRFAVTRVHPDNRFYNPPPVRRHQQQLLRQKQQQLLQKQSRIESAEAEAEALARPDSSDDSALSRPNSVCSPSPPGTANSTNLDRLMESVTPSVRAHDSPELRSRRWRTREADPLPYYLLGDLWESFKEWSVFGAGVPLLLTGSEPVKQYYVPSLSGIQLYIDPLRLRRTGEDSDAETSRETSSAGSSDCEVERRGKGIVDASWNQHNLINSNSQKMNRLTLREKPLVSSSSDEAEVGNSSGTLIFEYLEQEQPHHRKPFYDKVSILTSQFPDLKRYRSCDILPSSWICVAWYPIYRIPVGPTLQNFDASFLSFHPLSTHSKSTGKFKPQLHISSGRRARGVSASSKFSLPVFGLASYKLGGSILTPNGPHESQQANSLLQAADDWLRQLQVSLPDYQFFVSHNTQWR
ncbi:uncharacterized protein LOC115673654 isoform X3 [Syzygium oleosum]|uniref:uncharacterized protein LOC115673654 isoform X3 n=1 Tax=Syzygium oleosum TaxID=219896 RepID=UPI0024BBE39A|nr:uncharacterized protein LOC115673654 isoform X3 [Syzygium oleosum]